MPVAKKDAFETLQEHALLIRPRIKAAVATFRDPENFVQEAMLRALVYLNGAESPAELDERLEAVTKPTWLPTAARNAAISTYRHLRRELPAFDPVAHAQADMTQAAEDQFLKTRDRLLRQRALRIVTTVLFHRGGHDGLAQAVRPRLTEAQWATLLVMEELAHDPDIPERGLQARAAFEQGLTRATVNGQLKAVRGAVYLTRYVAGVLARPETLLDAEGVESCLVAYESWLPERAAADEMARAATSVDTEQPTGTRARVSRLRPPAPSGAETGAMEAIHALEASYAAAIACDQPNCIAQCAPHNPTLTRTTEF